MIGIIIYYTSYNDIPHFVSYPILFKCILTTEASFRITISHMSIPSVSSLHFTIQFLHLGQNTYSFRHTLGQTEMLFSLLVPHSIL